MQQSYCTQQRELHHDVMAQAEQTKMDRRILWINYGQNAVKGTIEDKPPSQLTRLCVQSVTCNFAGNGALLGIRIKIYSLGCDYYRQMIQLE